MYMKLRIKELCEKRGLRMSDLAEKMGVNQANLSASLKGNPTLSRLNDVAKILGVEIQELFVDTCETKGSADGFIEADGRILRIQSKEDVLRTLSDIKGIPHIEYYEKVSDMRASVSKFVRSTLVDFSNPSSVTGCLMGTEIFTLSFLPETYLSDEGNRLGGKYALSLVSKKKTFVYDLLEFDCGGNYDIDGDTGLIALIRNDIEWQYESMESATEA